MKRADRAICRQIGQRFPNTVNQLIHRRRGSILANQRQIRPTLDIGAQNTEKPQFAFLIKQLIHPKQLCLNLTENRIVDPILFFNPRFLQLQFVLCANQLVFLRQPFVRFRQLLPNPVDFGDVLHPVYAPVVYRRALQPQILRQKHRALLSRFHLLRRKGRRALGAVHRPSAICAASVDSRKRPR